jgi:hypothetical protein
MISHFEETQLMFHKQIRTVSNVVGASDSDSISVTTFYEFEDRETGDRRRSDQSDVPKIPSAEG